MEMPGKASEASTASVKPELDLKSHAILGRSEDAFSPASADVAVTVADAPDASDARSPDVSTGIEEIEI